MSKHNFLRKVIAATAISAALVITSVTGGTASADTGTHEVGHWMGVAPASSAPIHRSTDVTMKRGVIGDGTSNTVLLAEVVPAQAGQPVVVRYNLTQAWP